MANKSASTSQKFRAIIFDVGRVLIRVDFSRALAGLAEKIPLSPEEIWTAIHRDPRWNDWQEGRIAPRDWHRHLTQRLGGSLTFEQFADVWNRALDPQPVFDNALFETLSRRYRLALLSNTDPIHVAHFEANYEFPRYFPARIYSCNVGASKPDPVIYQAALRACKVRAGEAIYIDDMPDLVEAARRLGITAIQFHSPEQLTADLASLGIPTP